VDGRGGLTNAARKTSLHGAVPSRRIHAGQPGDVENMKLAISASVSGSPKPSLFKNYLARISVLFCNARRSSRILVKAKSHASITFALFFSFEPP